MLKVTPLLPKHLLNHHSHGVAILSDRSLLHLQIFVSFVYLSLQIHEVLLVDVPYTIAGIHHHNHQIRHLNRR